MGEVYEAEDRELREHVALKTILPEIASDERAIARFKREIQLARKVTHPNVCRIFDLFHHQEGPRGELTFLSMELLAGETLAHRLRRVGRMTPAEALPIITQMTAALDAAHQAQIIHRDFKSANVMLVPGAREAGPARAVVTDFGLARSSAVEDSSASALSGAGMLGTPAYMSPEQVKGEKVTAAADLYALGVVMYEMITGQRPFVGDTPLSTAIRRLQESPPSPRAQVPDLDRRWEAAILRCLEREPGARFAAAGDVAKALREEMAPAGPWTRRATAWAALALLMVLSAFVFFQVRDSWKLRETSAPSAAKLVQSRRSVAVLGFKNLSGRAESGWLSTALSEMLTTELAAGERLRTVPGENVARMKMDLSLAEAESFARDTLGRIRSHLGADFVVLGAYLPLGDKAGGQIRLDLRLQDTVAGETIASMIETGAEPQLFELVARTGERLREKLGAGGLSPAQQGAVQASLPSNPEAARLYSEGLAKLRTFEALAAREPLEKAVTLEPGHAQTHSALAAAWSSLGYDANARAEAKRAFELSEKLSREDRLSIEGRYRETTREWSPAIEIYRTLWGFFPDNLDYGLRLAAAQTTAGKGKDSLATLESLRALPSPAGADPRIDLAEAAAARSLADYKRAMAAAVRGAEKGAGKGARLVVARGRFDEGSALHNLGELDRAKALLEEAHRLFTEAGDRVNAARSLNNASLVVADRGDLDGARKMLEQVLAAYRAIGNQSGVALASSNLGNVQYFRGDLGRARQMWERSLAVYREIDEKDGMARMFNNIASALAMQGNLAGARKSFQQAYETYREIGNRDLMTTALLNIAKLLFDDGDLSGAKKSFQETLARWREIGNKDQSSGALHSLGQIFEAEGDLAAARKHFEEALALRVQIGKKVQASETRLALAGLAAEQARHEQAQAQAREAAEEFRKQKMPDDEASAHNIDAQSLLDQGKRSEAQQALERSQSLLRKSENRRVKLSVAITAARLGAGSGKSADALKILHGVLVEATTHGLITHQLDARLALGEIEVKSTAPAAGRARLEALEKDAAAKGFGRIARKAAEARR